MDFLEKIFFYNYGTVLIICTLKEGTHDDKNVKLPLCFNKHTELKEHMEHKNISTHYQLDIIQSGPKKCIHSLLINIFGINLNEISILRVRV